MDDSERWVRRRGFLPDWSDTTEPEEESEYEPRGAARPRARVRPRPTRQRAMGRRRLGEQRGPRQMSDRD